MDTLKKRLDFWADKKNSAHELSLEASADPLQVACKYNDEFIALVCALFAYGNARAIVNFLSSLDFTLLDAHEDKIKKALEGKIYRFQTNEDVVQFFLSLNKIKQISSLQDIFLKGYNENSCVISGIKSLISHIYDINPYRSRGYEFLIGKIDSNSPYKRYNMYLRWMVRKDNLDLGLWQKVSKSDLLAPLDTHTHKMALKLGLIKRKTYDLKACLELTEAFKKFDKNDPIKYDFALYRIGQEKLEV